MYKGDSTLSVLASQRVWLYRHFIVKLNNVNLLRDAPPSPPCFMGFYGYLYI